LSVRISPLQIYKFLPKKNCGECGVPTCMAFAAKIIEGTITVEACPHITPDKKAGIESLVAPPVKAIKIGRGDKAVTIGGEKVLYRHELKFFNKTAIAVDLDDSMTKDEMLARLRKIEELKFTRVGETLHVDLIALKSAVGNPKTFADAVSFVMDSTKLPMILCSLNPAVMEAGVNVAGPAKPLIYAATFDNYQSMSELAKKNGCPLAVHVRNVNEAFELTSRLERAGVEELVIDFDISSIREAVNNLVITRRSAIIKREVGYPTMTVPALNWLIDANEVDKAFSEALTAAISIVRYSSLVVLHSAEMWSVLPILTLRQGIFSDPVKPAAVNPGLYTFGTPNKNSPVMVTTNFALTYHTVTSDIESAKINCYLLVLDTDGLSVATAVAGGRFTAEVVSNAIKKTGLEGMVAHKHLIIPGVASALKSKIEDATGWRVLVGPMDSSGIFEFIKAKWPPKVD
jgi:acetyl-CoA decarbonylase/synthase complex subunit gamma